MNIYVESLYSIKDKIKRESISKNQYCISILDPNEAEHQDILQYFLKTLRLRFDDIESPVDNKTFFSKDVLQKTLDFYNLAKLNNIDSLIVHCHAGVHRSTAIALILLYLEHGDEDIAKEFLIKSRAIALPNRQIISLFDEKYDSNLLQTRSELYERVRKYMKNELEILADNYLEELESID
jgi:predicted protein tyrosine phosphatase